MVIGTLSVPLINTDYFSYQCLAVKAIGGIVTYYRTMDIYREEILEHYRNPHNFGELHEYDRKIDEANPLCGDNLTLFLKYSGKGSKKIIKEASFTGVGCALSTAAASLLTDKVKGQKVTDLARFDKEAMLKLLGSSVAPARLKCVLLPLEALREALI